MVKESIVHFSYNRSWWNRHLKKINYRNHLKIMRWTCLWNGSISVLVWLGLLVISYTLRRVVNRKVYTPKTQKLWFFSKQSRDRFPLFFMFVSHRSIYSLSLCMKSRSRIYLSEISVVLAKICRPKSWPKYLHFT